MSSERSLIVNFLRTIDEGDLIALEPDRERFNQDEGHDEARTVAASRGIADPSWVFWHHQSSWVFNARGELVSGLLMHWGGDHDRVLSALSMLPSPLRVIDHGEGRAFEIVSDDAEARIDADFPDVADTKSVKARIQAITGPVARRNPATWTATEVAWFETVLIHGDLAAQSAVVGWVTKLPTLSATAVDNLVANWTSIYPKAPSWVLVTDLLRRLADRGDPRLDALLDITEKRKGHVFRAGASHFLIERLRTAPHEETAAADLERLSRFAHDPGRYAHTPGNGAALRGLVEVLGSRNGQSQAVVATELLTDATFDESARNELTKLARLT